MSADVLISRLEKVKRTGNGTWMARCPGHPDRSPSLSIKDCGDGRILLRCHAGCDTESVLSAIGLTFADVLPPRPIEDRMPPVRRPFPAGDVLEAIFEDALWMQQIAAEVQRTGEVTPEQRGALYGIVARVSAARDLVNG